jgi:hypothetical protein
MADSSAVPSFDGYKPVVSPTFSRPLAHNSICAIKAQ